MDMNDRPTPVKRSDSLLRLRTVTTGVALAGVAATVGFGFAAASGYRGSTGTGADAPVDAGTQDSTFGTNTTPIPFQQAPDDNGSSSGSQLQQAAPQDNGSGATAPGNAVQPPTRSSRRSHAATGSS